MQAGVHSQPSSAPLPAVHQLARLRAGYRADLARECRDRAMVLPRPGQAATAVHRAARSGGAWSLGCLMHRPYKHACTCKCFGSHGQLRALYITLGACIEYRSAIQAGETNADKLYMYGGIALLPPGPELGCR